MRWKQMFLVLGGYVLACLAAGAVVYAYQLLTQSAAAQASAGMYAFGDLILFAGACGVFAVIPTALAVCFVLRNRQSR